MNGKKNYTIFVGSTYSDLVEYRRTIMAALNKLKTIVNGMEYFGSRTGSPIEECLNAIRESEVYIGIFAMRYGSIEEKSGKSFTHLEFLEAQNLGLPSLIYLIDEKSKHVQIKMEDIDFGGNAVALANLKKELKNKFTVSFFTTPEDLSARISQDLPPVLEKLGINVDKERLNVSLFNSSDGLKATPFEENKKNDNSEVTILMDYLYVYPDNIGPLRTVPLDAISNINKQKKYGYSDWRLPTMGELEILGLNASKLNKFSIENNVYYFCYKHRGSEYCVSYNLEKKKMYSSYLAESLSRQSLDIDVLFRLVRTEK